MLTKSQDNKFKIYTAGLSYKQIGEQSNRNDLENFYECEIDFYIKCSNLIRGVWMSINVTASVDEDLVRIIDRIAKEEGLDRSTVIRRFLHRAVSEWLIEKSLKDYEDGKLTLWHAAKKCNLSLWEIINEVKKRNIHVPYTFEDLKEDLKGLE